MGGVTEAFVIVTAFIFVPISEHMFTIEASKKLFYARTKTKDFFIDDKLNPAYHGSHFNNKKACLEIKNHHIINISIKDGFCLFISNRLRGLFPDKIWSKKKKLTKLYEKSSKRIES